MGLIIDSFAGGGGASKGIEMALGRSPDIAINHDERAISMHRINNPDTTHYIEDIWEVDPVKATHGEPVDLMWASPDCTHFSKARGKAPTSARVRGLAWVVVRWASVVRPKVIIMENVEEFKTWGPIDQDGYPIKALAGITFEQFVDALRKHGYAVDWRELRGCDYGAPTSRRRFVLIARCDGESMSWPDKTHGPGTGKPYHTAGECIDFDLVCRSIFGRPKPLAEATMRRIAAGVVKFVLNCPNPFIVKNNSALVSPALIQMGYGERKGQKPRVLNLEKPLGTIPAQGNKFALVSAFLSKHYSGAIGSSLHDPMGTVTSADHHSIVACSLMRQFGTSTGQSLNEPMLTIMPGGSGKTALVAAFLTKYYGTGDGSSLSEPMHTITAKDRMGLVTVLIDGTTYAIYDIGMRMLQPSELYLAQGFPENYIINFEYKGKPLSKEAQVKMVGNSVCPPLAAALVKANHPAVLEGVA